MLQGLGEGEAANVAHELALSGALEISVRLRFRAGRIAISEALQRVAERPLATAVIETRVRVDAMRLYLHADVEIPTVHESVESHWKKPPRM